LSAAGRLPGFFAAGGSLERNGSMVTTP
jgi:hypothetical protein